MGDKTGALTRALSLAQGEFHRGFGPAPASMGQTEPAPAPRTLESLTKATFLAHNETGAAIAALQPHLPGVDLLAVVAAGVGWPPSPEANVLAAIIRMESAVAAAQDADRMLVAFQGR